MKECPICEACTDDTIDVCPIDGARQETRIPGPPLLDGKYRLERRLGHGGMGVVYRAHHVAIQRPVAIKIITSSDPGFIDRFRIEAAALGQLKHPHIVDVLDFGGEPARQLAYLVMELLDGVTLADRWTKSSLPPVDEAISIVSAIGAAVDFAHARGILHRDLKPHNVMLVMSDAGTSIKILDFGLAQFVEAGSVRDVISSGVGNRGGLSTSSDETTTISPVLQPLDAARRALMDLQQQNRGLLMGTYGYMAPELFRFEPATTATDIYAFGVIAYELLTGARPPARQTHSDVVRPPSAITPRVPVELDAPVLSLLEYTPASRPRTARDAVAAIRRGQRAAAIREWLSRERPRRTVAAALVAALALSWGALWTATPIDRLERRTLDARFAVVTPHAPSPQLLLLTLDDASVDADARPLALRADEFGTLLGRVFDAGAGAVGVDLLLPSAWAQSGAFAQLIASHPDTLTLGAFATESGAVIGPECVPGIVGELLGRERVASLFGYVNLDSDSGGIAHRATTQFSTTDGGGRPGWAARVARTAGFATPARAGEGFWIDYAADAARLDRLAWRDVARAITESPQRFQDRIVLVGAEFTASGDDHRMPGPGRARTRVSGMVVQALAVNTIVEGLPLRDVGQRWIPIAATTTAAAAIAFLLLMRHRATAAVATLVFLVAVNLTAAFSVFAATRVLLPIVGPAVSLLVALGAAVAIRFRWGARPVFSAAP